MEIIILKEIFHNLTYEELFAHETSDSLEADFQRWELDSELEELRKNI